MTVITQEFVKELFDYKDGLLYWKKEIGVLKPFIGTPAGYKDISTGYMYILIKRKKLLTHRLIFLWHHGFLPKMVDHKDRNRSNNLIENLRVSDHQKNGFNRNSSKGSSSQYLGVRLFRGKKWRAQITISNLVSKEKKYIHLGTFSTEEGAALAYNNAAKIHFGEYANLNIILKANTK